MISGSGRRRFGVAPPRKVVAAEIKGPPRGGRLDSGEPGRDAEATEAVFCLYSGTHNDEVQLYAFDILALEGDDLRKLPLHLRKTNLARLLARRADGIHLAPFEQGEIGPELFRAACSMMLEGLVSKRRDSRYRAGLSRDWIKIKNPKSPAMNRAKDAFS